MESSISPQPAQPPTLFDAGADPQLLFEMRGMTDEIAEEFNAKVDTQGNRDWSACAKLVAENGVEAVFIGCKSATLENNLLYIRESMADVLAWLYRERFLVNTETTALADLCDRMIRENPLHYKIPDLYEKVIKDFLFATFAGMTSSRPWNGREQVSDGDAVVLSNGDALRYHTSERERFRSYLLHHACIEYVSCREFRWGFVQKDRNGRYILPLNAAIRLV